MEYVACKRCVMDTSDTEISFDEKGYCNHCTAALLRLSQAYFPDKRGEEKLHTLLEDIRKSGKGKPYDCLIGVSGGIDSSWLTYLSKDWGLRPLVFHVDGGWNTEVAEGNVQTLLDKLGYTLDTHVVAWQEMRDLQRAYLESSLANQDVPQDHAFFAVLFKKAAAMGITYWLSGSNLVSESILPRSWGYMAMDARQITSIHKRFGQVPLQTYSMLNFWDYCRFYSGMPLISPVRAVAPLNLVPYNPAEAKETLMREIGWKNYGRKHSESVFTRFFQNYYLPVKFNYDKRKAHYSSLIVAGQMTRDEALELLQEPLYDKGTFEADKTAVLAQLGYSEKDWDRLMALPNKNFMDYPNWGEFMALGRKVKGIFKQLGLVQ